MSCISRYIIPIALVLECSQTDIFLTENKTVSIQPWVQFSHKEMYERFYKTTPIHITMGMVE